MSVYSMTGYATAHSGADGMPEGLPGLGVEIRSVNSRFLDLVMKLPEELRGAEPALRELLGSRLRRGKVEVRVWIEGRHDAGQRPPTVAELQRLASVQDLVRSWLPQATTLSVAEVIQFTGRQTTDPGALQAPLMHLAAAALEGLLDARRREGRRLADMLQDRAARLRQLAADAQPLIPKLVEQQRQRFLERWNEALGTDSQGAVPSEAAHDRALSEATAFAIRIDVAEELTRLDAHLGEIERLIARGAELGKRLDFLIQELHREANTLGSKSSSLELTRISVDMKVLIEQMREQVQNLE
ncbi:MAG TPA: YicC family protein [Hydrogenophaga sp.]|uniref:YicC/YloC family endoribonuclease n=1 Tax=Hydrogenophaga sp. TaxID=1904254 RepID=UPI002BB95CF8|nr:YicC/YloC family endoribonuclease [Hydrogenophaga sp.]HMN92706.1 YicC family protein [Hydrogenophaga sp.]HMP08864.1 YicC family protein [Hydrogenophaga sp.]